MFCIECGEKLDKALVKELGIYVEIAGHRERVKLLGEE